MKASFRGFEGRGRGDACLCGVTQRVMEYPDDKPFTFSHLADKNPEENITLDDKQLRMR